MAAHYGACSAAPTIYTKPHDRPDFLFWLYIEIKPLMEGNPLK